MIDTQNTLERIDADAKHISVPAQAGYYGEVARLWIGRTLLKGITTDLVYALARRAADVAIGWDWPTCDVCDLPTPERMTRFVDDRDSAEAFQVYEQRMLVCDDGFDSPMVEDG